MSERRRVGTCECGATATIVGDFEAFEVTPHKQGCAVVNMELMAKGLYCVTKVTLLGIGELSMLWKDADGNEYGFK